MADWKVADLTAVILAGGRGSRLQEDTNDLIPKPMVTIGDKPMLEHIVNIYANQGVTKIIVATGHLGQRIADWAATPASVMGMRVAVVPTGEDTQTGGRLVAVREHVLAGNDEWLPTDRPFFMTYGDGLSDINLPALLEHHMRLRKTVLATLTAVHPPARFGSITIDRGKARVFLEKSQTDGWINGGFYVVEPKALDMVPGPACRWEYDVLPILSHQGRLAAFQHPGWWMCMDTRRDREYLEEAWTKGDAPWTRWAR